MCGLGPRGVNLHARVTPVNDPFTFDRHGVIVHRLLYGMILFARTLGPNARLLAARVRHAPPPVKAWVVSIAGGDPRAAHQQGPAGATVSLALPACGPAAVQRLLAPGPAALDGETFGGRRLNQPAHWVGDAESETIPEMSRSYLVPLPAYSAALVSLRASGVR
jgi:hypothetical protein